MATVAKRRNGVRMGAPDAKAGGHVHGMGYPKPGTKTAGAPRKLNASLKAKGGGRNRIEAVTRNR